MNAFATVRVPLRFLALLLISVATGCGNPTDLPRDSQTVGGIKIYLGVVPATRVPDHPTEQGVPGALHGGTPEGRGSHHVVVALFDATTGARITDAQVRVGVGVGNQADNHVPDLPLESMEVNGSMSYGTFVLMPALGMYRIHLEIQLPGVAIPVIAQFVYERVTGE